jgi:hypothetical protein
MLWGAVVVNTRSLSRGSALADEYIVEVNGLDGLKHHVGPFRLREEAEAWIAQNPGAAEAETPLAADQPTADKTRRKHFVD